MSIGTREKKILRNQKLILNHSKINEIFKTLTRLELLFLQKCSTVDVLPVSKSTSVTSYIYIQIFQVYKPGETF